MEAEMVALVRVAVEMVAVVDMLWEGKGVAGERGADYQAMEAAATGAAAMGSEMVVAVMGMVVEAMASALVGKGGAQAAGARVAVEPVEAALAGAAAAARAPARAWAEPPLSSSRRRGRLEGAAWSTGY